ncbi:DUF1479-domain-containing protein [Coniochaeta ligniaria NRRL 30616]|uniref:DUF1479-domain-containing protein n=1 Tax=Coniochaeta ligniaria NRRL 30616 TaxID=1408157 RepID=A0A1J7JC81_9PEZI|nr:DUF1479-domain-containing protein [Coniochaeta ligniaria NRRL 30616]
MAAMATPQPKREGDISDSFASLSGQEATPLPDRFRELKLSLSAGREGKITASWNRLLKVLKHENDIVAKTVPRIIPQVRFSHLDQDIASLKDEIKKRGAAVIRGVIPEDEARSYKFEIEEYVRQNPHTRGFPAHNPQVIELYWSAPQLRARTHPNLMAAQTALMTKLWHVSDPTAPISLRQPLSYADRLRIREPGDAHFALGPHQDGGSLERWEKEGYGAGGGVYNEVFSGDWEKYDPFEAAGRVGAVTNLYNGLGACSMFRMFQGWLAVSRSGPEQGTLLVNPLLKESTSYSLLRPFFRPVKELAELQGSREDFLDERNWKFTAGEEMTSDIQGATPGHGQEFPEGLHPHLELDRTMVHVPDVRPGDFVVWHCDTMHAVDKKHNGTSDSSVLYIPVCPTTEESAKYVARQRATFLEGTPAPDFPGGIGESQHVGRPTEEYVRRCATPVGLQSFGLDKLVAADGETQGGVEAIRKANLALGFDQ